MSDDPDAPGLAFIGRQLARLVSDVATLREDVYVMAASRVRALEEKTS